MSDYLLNNFRVENFRLFEHLEIERLGRVNLFVGKNNVGKSTLLEAIELYINPVTPQSLYRLLSARQENWDEKNHAGRLSPAVHSLRHLFTGHHIPWVGSLGIIVGTTNHERDYVEIHPAAYRIIFDEDRTERVRLNSLREVQSAQKSGEVIEFSLEIVNGSGTRRNVSLNEGLSEAQIRNPLNQPPPRYPIEVIRTYNLEPEKVAYLWDEITLTILEDAVVEGLRLLEPHVKEVGFVQNREEASPTRVPVIRTSDTQRVSLSSFGDGMTRLFHIMLALVNARNGVLLIDEFENGLHWSVQPKIWRAIFELAERHNVQVFATTHSSDTVRGFQEAWEEFPNLGTFHRLEARKDAQIRARNIDLETLGDTIATDVEVR